MPITTQATATSGNLQVLSRRWVAQERQRVSQIHTHATLLLEQWRELDTLLLLLAEQYMGGVMDLRGRNLTHSVGNIGFSASQYNSVGDMDAATVDMRPSAAGNNQRLRLDPHLVPLPFVFEDYEFDARELTASQNLGLGLDTTHATMAMRKVMEGFESLLFAGTVVGTRDGNRVWGYTNQPQRVTGSATGTWDDYTQIYPTVLAMFQAMLTLRRMGPYGLYMNINQYGELHAQQGDDRAWNVLRRIQESFPLITSIKPVFCLNDGELVMVDLNLNTVDLAIVMEPGNVPWEGMGGLVQHVRVLGSLTPRVKVDGEGIVGVVHFSGA